MSAAHVIASAAKQSLRCMIRKDCFVAALLAMTVLVAPAHAALSAFEEANARYQSGDFKKARELYEKLAHAERPTAAIYYNLGNAYFRLGEKGKALIAYERALKGTPRDADIRWNLAILKSVLADRVNEGNENFVLFALKKRAKSFTIDELNILFTLSLLLFAVCMGVVFVFPSSKPFFGFVQTLLVLFMVAAAVLWFLEWRDVREPSIGVLAKEVSAHYGPSYKETKAFVLHEGAEAKVRDETDKWYFIALPDGNSGWIPKDSCEMV